MTTPADWYDDGSGQMRYWDGERWTEHVAPITPPQAIAPAPSESFRWGGRHSVGVMLILFGVGIFIVASIVQGACGSSMFSSRYSSDVGAIKEFLINVTFWPGWVVSGGLVLRGVLTMFASPKK